jgi:hypothetical protein
LDIELSVVIESGNEDVDLSSALETIRGTAEVVNLASTAVFSRRIPEKLLSSNSNKVNIKQSFNGSYGQNFTLVVNKPEYLQVVNSIGKVALAEIISYFIHETLNLEHPELSTLAEEKIDEMDELKSQLCKRLRNPLKRMHKVSIAQNYGVQLNYKGDLNVHTLANINSETIDYLTNIEIDENEFEVDAVVNRFNSFTGNGRLLVQGESNTAAFGFSSYVGNVRMEIRKIMSQNLHNNNGVAEDRRDYLRLTVKKMMLPSGEIVKYLIAGVQ